MKRFLPPRTPEEQIFCKQVLTLAARSEKTTRPCFSSFLDERQQQLAEAQLAASDATRHLFFGGFSGAERKVLCVYLDEPPETWEWPFCVVRLRWKAGGASLTHRDYLGALMGLGIERRCLGDLLLCDDGAYLFVVSAQAQTVCDELTSVGRVSVNASVCSELPQSHELPQPRQRTINVASLRVDAVLAAALHVSRGEASALVTSGKVMVSHLEVDNPSFLMEEGDSLTVRGVGKFRLQQIGGESKKGRLFLTLLQY